MHLKLLNIECFTLVQFMCVDHAVWQNTLDKTCVDCTCVKIRAQFDPVDEVDVQWGAGTCTGTARPSGCPVGGSQWALPTPLISLPPRRGLLLHNQCRFYFISDL